MKQDRNKDGIFPDGKIILLDGRLVDCYPLATNEPDSVMDDTLGINLTGQYPSPFKKETATSLEGQEEKNKLFTDYAFYLLAHRERILTDSRMFLCPVPIQNGLAISGTSGFENPILGVYLLWWHCSPGAMRTDKKGRRSLVYRLAGSGLSSGNCCSEVYEDGSTQKIWLETFHDCFRSFMKINKTYDDAKRRYQAYSLRQVLDILKREEKDDKGYAHTINEQFNRTEIDILNTRLLSLQKRELKMALRQGIFTNKEYEPIIVQLNKRIRETEAELSHFKYEEINKIFPDDPINFCQIEDYIKKLKENGHKTDNM